MSPSYAMPIGTTNYLLYNEFEILVRIYAAGP